MLINDKLSLLNSSALSGYKKKMAARNYIQERPTQIRILLYCTLWEECKQTQCPHRSSRESSKALMWYYSPTKNKLIYQDRANTYDLWLSGQYGKYNSNIFLFHPLEPFPSKMMRCSWIVLISSHSSTQIWRIRYGGSRSIYFFSHGVLGRSFF